MKHLIPLLLFGFLACNSRPKERKKSSAIAEATAPYKSTLLHGDSVILLQLNAHKLPDSIVQNIAQPYQQVHIEIANINTQQLVATLRTPGTGRNLRFNQIILPNGKMDGPFGQNINYTTKQKGTYQLILAKDNMADGKTTGEVIIKIKCN